MKSIAKIISIVAVVAVLAISLTLPSCALSVNMTPNGTTVDYTKNVTIKISITADEPIITLQGNLSYDASKFQYVSAGGDYVGQASAGNIPIYDEAFNGSERTASYSLVFKALGIGDTTASFSGFYVNENLQQVSLNQTVNFSAVDPSLSDANLKSLTVSSGSLYPRFSAATTNYSVTVGNAVEQIDVNATVATGASLTGTGSVMLKEGNNKHTITVTAQDGTKKTYTLTIKRLTVEEEEAQKPEEPVDNTAALTVKVGTEEYRILESLPEGAQAPLGFEVSQTVYNDITVPIYKSGTDYEIFTLSKNSDGTTDYYTYDKIRDEFVLLPYMLQGERMYIFADIDDDLVAPYGYVQDNKKLGNSDVKVFYSNNNKLSDFCIFYAYVNGKYCFYRYDMYEGTLQRVPDFELIETESEPVSGDDTTQSSNWFKSFSNMKAAGKAVVIATAIAIISAVTLVVLLIVRQVKMGRLENDGIIFEPEESPFDDVNEYSANDISNAEKDSTEDEF